MRCNNKIYLHMMFYICTILDVENKTREVKCLKLFMYITAIQLYPALSVL